MIVEITEVSCYKCGISFWITLQYNAELKNCHNDFYCPNGHGQHYSAKTDTEKAKEERDRYKRWYNDEKETSERLGRSNSALRGVITRNKNK
ncbi:hypothetical protein LCGC14_1200150 [marine sediment metagenome]|uniref:Uncharacterized protein n=1 Tax=marine sediment metagenome TaxID=412755 RepID=A0A0F9LHA0_9ZZZZ